MKDPGSCFTKCDWRNEQPTDPENRVEYAKSWVSALNLVSQNMPVILIFWMTHGHIRVGEALSWSLSKCSGNARFFPLIMILVPIFKLSRGLSVINIYCWFKSMGCILSSYTGDSIHKQTNTNTGNQATAKGNSKDFTLRPLLPQAESS